jgi:predicted 3-demethylubiquinone-9 3-methyltransferase (glyoxalase superfamily)
VSDGSRNGVGWQVNPDRFGDTMSTRTIATAALVLVVIVIVVVFVL